MLITKKGSIDGVPYTSMVSRDNVWLYLLVCCFPRDTSTELLLELFDTNTVEDDTIGVRWEYTQFDKITEDENNKYVWLTYTVQNIIAAQYEEALNILGVETILPEEKQEVI